MTGAQTHIPARIPAEIPEPGLYIVATPIGNLADITLRAIAVLQGAALIACEDTRVTGKLLKHLGIKARLQRLDDHASPQVRARIIAEACDAPVVLVSDAGTPLISDPGYRLVREARDAGVNVVAVPGACAAIAGLAISGLPSDRFLFAGFLPVKDKAREEALAGLAGVAATLVFYETAPRLEKSLRAIATLWPGREVAVAREITKMHEECRSGTAAALADHYATHPPKGEIVLLIGPPTEEEAPVLDIDAMLRAALADAGPGKAAGQVAKASGIDRAVLYARALELKGE
ncbi:MAG: 16S rRNA (cytidine(1402)-2'-O)-methyltransferase [Erythrobacter sp.]|jgi:16S rRNA (cytidine1402-2'-O)-methyltransferase|uniref:16S rRNA (cytidine(1402)-2'-O)-methyltransferase n=1 Tax=Erythrobacter sp. TaxID=1042 RepID=UPI002B4A1454|nr:16S rRNA (cytidine(1402)-2'-O)-methyltransferase [Erythrobacter sp.]WRH71016.1 MAG: 16S rRNA (cytidine(1402)-2'-O)-methyltransferase [Erythrobacter sp.]